MTIYTNMDSGPVRLTFQQRKQEKLKELLKALGAPLPWTDEWPKWAKEHSAEIVKADADAEEFASTHNPLRKRLQS